MVQTPLLARLLLARIQVVIVVVGIVHAGAVLLWLRLLLALSESWRLQLGVVVVLAAGLATH